MMRFLKSEHVPPSPQAVCGRGLFLPAMVGSRAFRGQRVGPCIVWQYESEDKTITLVFRSTTIRVLCAVRS